MLLTITITTDPQWTIPFTSPHFSGFLSRERFVAMGMASEIDRKRKFLLGIGYFVQGLRCFPWMGVNFFLKDGMRVAPATLQILQNSANLPMVAKPLYGILSDCVYVFAEHRIPYIAFGGIQINFPQFISFNTNYLELQAGYFHLVWIVRRLILLLLNWSVNESSIFEIMVNFFLTGI